ncbi:sulfate adenylyltransferase subunit CysN [Jatrophihabitans sp.]|jgi:bifunctional enzyme CysN/CysC|uniref:sulfate adenylyltransferase subunit CysN n=1 Tax=Jatrophihabitans sp. TaxID=1932789 RepID=UPI002EE442A9
MTVPGGLGTTASEIEEYLGAHERKSMLRFITCGSVDDGKSTLIGRLLYESKLILDDQLSALEADSKRFGTQGDELDLALLVDGLAAEREQGITIDVAYRFFTTANRKFVVADTPGHEQYTRNMVTGASTADLAVILVDARKGVLTQTRRHSFLVSLLGIRNIVLAINKLDLVDFSQSVAAEIEADYRRFAEQLGIQDVVAIPMSALTGDNVTSPSTRMPWYDGPTLLGYLEQVQTAVADTTEPFRMPVQWINRPDQHFRGASGMVVRGSVRPGDRVQVLPGGNESTVARVVTADGDLEQAIVGQSVTLTLTDEIDVSRGNVLSSVRDAAQVGDQFEAHVVWMSEQRMLPLRSYLFKQGTRRTMATMSQPKYKINVNTLERAAATSLSLNEIGVCNLSLDEPIAFDPYGDNRDMGGFILIDRLTNDTVAAGLLNFALRRSSNISWQAIEVDKQAHVALKGHQPCVVWFTGLSGAGKSTIANLVEKRLHADGRHTYLLDGDNVRHGLNRDLGFNEIDRIENIRRVAEVSKLMVDAGLIVLASFISPYAADRAMARNRVGPNEFCEVFVDTPLSVAEDRDRKGLYGKARSGKLPNFTGIDSPYEAPQDPEVHIDTTTSSPEEAAEQVIAALRRMGVID